MLRVLCLLCVGAAVAQVHPPVGPSEKRPFTSYFTADQETSLNGTIGYIKADSGGKLYEYQQLIFGAANAPLPAKPGKNGTKAITEEFVLNLTTITYAPDTACTSACCAATLNVNYTLELKLPGSVWAALISINDKGDGKPINKTFGNPMNVSGMKTFSGYSPTFKLSELVGEVAVTEILTYTGTELEFDLSDVMASQAGGLSFHEDTQVSLLSEKASKLCNGGKKFCCADPTAGPCCCSPKSVDFKCTSRKGGFHFISEDCDDATGASTKCSDTKVGSVTRNGSAPVASSACAIFKEGLYNATGGAKTGQVDLVPLSKLDVFSWIYQVLNVQGGAAEEPPSWLVAGKAFGAESKFSYGDLTACNTAYQKFKHMAWWKKMFAVIAVLAVLGLVVVGGLYGFKAWQRKKGGAGGSPWSVNANDSIYGSEAQNFGSGAA